MAKTILGIDIGSERLKLVLMSGRTILKTASVPMPEHLVQNGRVVSIEAMGELLRQTMRENKIRAQHAACILGGEKVYVRNVTMPLMTADQLTYNLPYEFRDYLTEEASGYYFDYAMLSTMEELSEEPAVSENGTPVPRSMELMAVAAPKELVEDMRAMLRKAGLRMAKAAPAESAYAALIRNAFGVVGKHTEEYCILDLGYASIRMHMYAGDCHTVSRTLEIGLNSIDAILAEKYNVDIHLAHTYFLKNYEDCQNSLECTGAYLNIGVELMRAINFYRFSNPESILNDIWLCGGGAAIAPLCEAITENLGMQIHPASELLPQGASIPESHRMLLAAGITME